MPAERFTLHDNLAAGLDKAAVPGIVGREYDLGCRDEVNTLQSGTTARQNHQQRRDTSGSQVLLLRCIRLP